MSTVIPIQPWEIDTAAAVGVSVLTLRFALSFFASILTGFLFRFIPTVKGDCHLGSGPQRFVLALYGQGMIAYDRLVSSRFVFCFITWPRGAGGIALHNINWRPPLVVGCIGVTCLVTMPSAAGSKSLEAFLGLD
jgi:hypothetical protein